MINSKLPETETTIFTVMSAMAKKYNAINLSQGFPDFESDPKLIELVNTAMKAGHNQYAPMPGLMSLRETISEKQQLLYGKAYNPESEITITAGATQAIFTALACSIEAGDEVIVFSPAYDCYVPTIKLFGGKSIAIQLRPPSYTPIWDEVRAAIGSKTKMIIINSPHNPTGSLFSEEDMRTLEDIVEMHNLLLISDEVYEHMVFDGKKHHSAAAFEALAKRSFITASFGKTFHNTGWKMGYCLAPKLLMQEFRKVHQYNVFCVNHPVQVALASYMQNAKTYLELPDFYQQKRDYFLNKIAGSRFKFIPSQGTYFQLLDYSEISEVNDLDFSEKLTKEFGIATIPTSVFNKNQENFHQIRICFAKTESTIDAASEILNSI